MLRPWEKDYIQLRDRLLSAEPPASGWKMASSQCNGYTWDHATLGLRVMQTVVVINNQTWIHTSLSRPKKWKLPTYEDVRRVRRAFLSEEQLSLQVFPPSNEHVNLANVLHLYTPIEAPDLRLPDFRVEILPGVWDLQ